MSIVWDREFGFLKEVLVSPVSRTSIVVGKILGSSTIAIIQGAIILLFSPLLSHTLTPMAILQSFGLMLLVAITISSFGILLASVIKTMQGFQVITNFLLMPMFFLSGAIFPLIDAPQWMVFLSKINP
ncbi:MAG: ABC transporter permease [Actinomycetota bacterium]|nr:ABC transporter permease [Actinomycetota bacterium]